MGSHIIQEKFENLDMNNRDVVVEQAKTEVLSLLKRTIRPEFLNRIDEIVMFTPLNKFEVRQIVEIQILALSKMLAKKNLKLEIDALAIDHLAEVGFEPQFGARPIKRVIQREILNELSKQILAGKISTDGTIRIGFRDENLVFGN